MQEGELDILTIDAHCSPVLQFHQAVVQGREPHTDRAGADSIRVIGTLHGLYDNGESVILAVPGQQILADPTEGEVPVVEALEVRLACDKTLPWAFLIAADP